MSYIENIIDKRAFFFKKNGFMEKNFTQNAILIFCILIC